MDSPDGDGAGYNAKRFARARLIARDGFRVAFLVDLFYTTFTSDIMQRSLILLAMSLLMGLVGAFAQAPDKRPLANGDFKDSPVGQPPAGWTAAYPTGGGVIFSDGKETFLRITSAQGANAGMAQEVKVPPKATNVAVLGRMRGKPENQKTDKHAAVEVALRFKDINGGNISAAVVASGNSPNWHTFRRDFALPPGCAKVEVLARSIFAIGTFDFTEVRVEFKEH